MILCILLLYFKVNVDFRQHNFPPDFYFVLGSIFFITIILMLQDSIIINKIKLITRISSFFYKHTFSIYLLHPFSIFLSEKLFGLTNPESKDIYYGATKLSVVLLLTCILAIPFTKIANKILLSLKNLFLIYLYQNKQNA